MVSATELKLLVSCFLHESGFIVVRSKYNEEVNRWLTAIGASFDAKIRAFKVQPSVSVAKLLIGCTLEHVHVEVSPEIHELAERDANSSIDFETQPECRVSDLWRHQVGAYSFIKDRDSALFDMGMGTGKSLPTVCHVVNSGARKTLIVCPTTVRGVWRREFAKWAGKPVDVLVLDKKSWSVERKAKEAEKFLMLADARGVPAVIVTNYESVWRPAFAKFALAQKWDCVIADESHRIGNGKSSVSKFCAKLGRRSRSRLCLSGTPLGHSPLSIFGQARFLDPKFFGSSWAQFRNRYAVTGHFGADHIVEYRNMEELSSIIDSFTYRVTGDVLDLPEERSIDIQLELPEKTRKLYDEFEKEMCAEIGDGVLTAQNGLVKLLRLQQMTSGFVSVEDELQELHRVKDETLSDMISDLPDSEPVVVFCKFREDLRRVEEVAKKLGRTFGEISSQRKDLTENATMPEGIQLMAVQIQSGGAGIDLVRASYAFYYSIGYSLTDFEQSFKRLHRPGQTRPVVFYHLVVKNSVDESIYKAIQLRQDLIESVLERLKNIGN